MSITKKRLSALAIFVALAALVPTALFAQVATSLDVADNEAFGPSVISVPGASHSESFFIAIHEGDAGSFAAVVGFSALLPPGAITDHLIQLNRPIVDGEYLWPMLHVDGNGNGVYDDAATDPPVSDTGAGNAAFGGILVFSMQVSTGEQAPSTPVDPPAAADTGNASLATTSEGFGLAPWLALLVSTVILVGASGLATRRR